MLELNTKPKLLAKHNQDPVKAAKKYGLCEQDVELIRKCDYDEIKKRFNHHHAASQVIVTFHTP
jgi:spore maturation protein CgeB